jgi:hypothetical protein
MSGGGVTGGARYATGGGATRFEMCANTGASLKRPVAVVRVGTSEPALSDRDVWTAVGGVNITASSVPLGTSPMTHVWNGAVNGDDARTSSEMTHSFVSTLLRPSRAFDISTGIYLFVQFSPNVTGISAGRLAGVRLCWRRAAVTVPNGK